MVRGACVRVMREGNCMSVSAKSVTGEGLEQADLSRQAELLDELVALFLKEGFAHWRMGVLATRLQCSRTTLYSIAPSKDELVELVVVTIAKRWIAESLAAAEPLPTGAERVVRYAEVMAASKATSSAQMWKDGRANPATSALIDQWTDVSQANFRRYLQEGAADGSVRELNTAFIATVIQFAAQLTHDPAQLERLGLSSGEAMLELARFIRTGLSDGTGARA